MSPEASLPSPADAAWASQKRKGLRVALAVAAGFTWTVGSGDIIPFFGPLFAAQFLLSSSRPMPLAQALAMALVILVAGSFFQFLAALTGDSPATFLLLIGLAYFGCFLAQASGKGGPAIFLILVVAIVAPMLTIVHIGLGESILTVLVKGVATGVALMWLAHALIPEPQDEVPVKPVALAHPRPIRRALADTAILLIALTLCLTQAGLATALVIPITAATLLSQLDAAATGRAALGLVVVNLFGGLAASVAFSIVQISPSLITIFLVMLFAGLVFGGRAAGRTAAANVHAGALTIFLLVLGTGISPLPGSAAETFATRLGYISFAILFTMLLVALLWPSPGTARQTRAND